VGHTPNGKWIPDSTARAYADLREQYGAELGVMLESGSAVTEEWNRVLYQVDPELRLVKAKENAHFPGITPGLYHVLRRNALGAPSIIPLQGPEGEFREPGSWMLDMLAEGDLWNDRTARERRRVGDELNRQKARRMAREKEERHEEILERWHAASGPGVSFANQGQGWRYRAGAPRSA
jgi:hypothetical protein